MKRIKLRGNNDLYALIDDEDYESVSQFKWYALKAPHTVYVWRKDENKRTQYLHTFLTGYSATDHVNHDGLDNQRSNLREVNSSENQWNKSKQKGAKSKYRCVTWNTRDKGWVVKVKAHGIQYYGGLFADEEMAARRADELLKRHHGEHANLNFPERGVTSDERTRRDM